MGDVIRARLAARPFVPMRFVLTGGTACDPDLVEVDGDDVVRLFRRAPDQPGGREWRTTISLSHVVSVEDAGDAPIIAHGG